jgi:hypothetical protein
MKLKLVSAVCVLFIVFLLTVFISCDQDSIFADIAVEPEPVDPRVAGSPTNIVVLDGWIYMASMGSDVIHRYKNNQWDVFSASGKVAGLASTSSKLYALVYHGDNRMDSSIVEYTGTDWITINRDNADSYSFQSIFGAEDKLFVGGNAGGSWDVFYVNDNNLTKVISNTAPLTGAAYENGSYFIATGGGGIYRVSGQNLSATPMAGSQGNITGIVNVNGTITASTRDGRILTSSGTGFNTILKEDIIYTGAMTVYKEYTENQWKNSLLLLGVQTSGSYNKGYRELALVNGMMPNDGRIPVIPGGELSSVKPENKSKYEASIARYSVYHIIQVPSQVDTFPSNPQGWEPLIFASTAGKGVYVLRNGLWNAQD